MNDNPTRDDKLVELDRLRKASVDVLQSLARDGVPNIDLGSARLELFIEFLLPSDADDERRIDFELIWEEKANEVLQSVAREVVRAKLTQGIGLVPPAVNGHGLRGV